MNIHTYTYVHAYLQSYYMHGTGNENTHEHTAMLFCLGDRFVTICLQVRKVNVENLRSSRRFNICYLVGELVCVVFQASVGTIIDYNR